MANHKRRSLLKLVSSAPLLATVPTGSSTAGPVCDASERSSDTMLDMEQQGFTKSVFSSGHYEHAVFSKGVGPQLVVMHELPGLEVSSVRFANRLVDANFTVHLPQLFGPLLRSAPSTNYMRLCISKEFAFLKSNETSPVCDWLRAYLRSLYASADGQRVGVIGMCLTGAFVIPMVLESNVRAAVISQPAIPFWDPYLFWKVGAGDWMKETNVSDQDIRAASVRLRRDEVPVIVQRFTDDRICPHARVARIAAELGEKVELLEYCAPNERSTKPHALLTGEYDKAACEPGNSTQVALQRVIAFFHENLG